MKDIAERIGNELDEFTEAGICRCCGRGVSIQNGMADDMTSVDVAGIGSNLAQASLVAAFDVKATAEPDAVALRAFGSDERLTWADWRTRARAVAGGMHSLGLRRGDRVALLLGTRMEFHIADMGALVLGAIPFSMYVTSPVNQMLEVADNAQPRVLVTEASLVDKARELQRVCPAIEHLVVVESSTTRDGEISLAALEALCPDDFDEQAAIAAAQRDDIATLVYTSGTTGPPKGVQFRNGAMMACLDAIRQRFATSREDRALSYLPMAHVAERIFGHYAAFLYGYEVTSLADLGQLPAALNAVRPTRFFGTPRIYEKLLAGIHRYVGESPERDALSAAWSTRCQQVRAEQAGHPLASGDDAELLRVLRPLAELTGLEHAHFIAVAGAPSSPEMLEELIAIGLPVNEFYGSSETIILSCSPPERIRIGTAGIPFDGVEVKLAEDGEILVAGPTVTPGYFRDPERTAEAFNADGWFLTGDVGAWDDEGYLKIIDRKKALIINAAGKNMSPANIELAIKGGQPLISQIVASGDRRPYNVALIVLDADGLHSFCRDHGVAADSFAERSRHGRVHAAVQAIVDEGNEKLSRVEQIKRFTILDHDWAPGGEQLTPTAKLKRREVLTQYTALIDEMYA